MQGHHESDAPFSHDPRSMARVPTWGVGSIGVGECKRVVGGDVRGGNGGVGEDLGR